VPFCPVRLDCILSFNKLFLYEQINDYDDDDDGLDSCSWSVLSGGTLSSHSHNRAYTMNSK